MRNDAVRPFQAAQIQIDLFLIGLRDFAANRTEFLLRLLDFPSDILKREVDFGHAVPLTGASNFLLLEGSGRFREVRASPA
jgi:hypothetical protein